MTDWWRSWHGAPTDPKWGLISDMANEADKRVRVNPGMVASVAWTLFDRASQADDRGSISGFDARVIARVFEYRASQVEAILAAMRTLGVIAGDRLAAWDKRQPKREREYDDSTPRVRKHRARSRENGANHDGDSGQDMAAALHANHETPCNATKRPESESESESETEEKDRADSARARDPVDEGRLEVECRKLIEGFPVSVDVNFVPILRLIDHGMTHGDVLEGITEALAKGLQPRSWRVFENFIREKCKDRIERALPLSAAAATVNHRAGPSAASFRVVDCRMDVMRKRFLEEKAREEAANAASGRA